MAAKRFHLSYRCDHVLKADGARWEIDAKWSLGGRMTSAKIDRSVRFDLELSSLDADWQTAIARARALRAATVDGVAARLDLYAVDLSFSRYDDDEHDSEPEPTGRAQFRATLDEPIPFPRNLDNPAFAEALQRAADEAPELFIQADAIEETERYWIFPMRNIGANGVIFDRSNGRVILTAGVIDRATWIWAYEHQLLEEPPGDIVVERVDDRDRVFEALYTFAKVYREDIGDVPYVLESCATWRAARPLKEAGDALTWRVTRPEK